MVAKIKRIEEKIWLPPQVAKSINLKRLFFLEKRFINSIQFTNLKMSSLGGSRTHTSISGHQGLNLMRTTNFATRPRLLHETYQ